MEWWKKERIGKLEKWILEHLYLKTVKGEVPELWKYPRDYERHRKGGYLSYSFDKYLFKSEILLNYFRKLRISKKSVHVWGDISEKFKSNKAYSTALSSYSRTVNRLEEKGYINIIVRKCSFPFSSRGKQVRGIELSDEGKERIEGILGLNVNSYI